MWRKLGFFFLALSLISFVTSGYLLWQRYYNPNRLSFATGPDSAPTSKFQLFPESLSIPELGIDLPIVPSEINNGVWRTTPVGISYLVTSTRPGDIGNSIFYGHNWPNLLGSLKKIRPGQKIIVRSKNDTKTFWVSRTQIVSPKEINVLSPGPHPQLTLYTCYGFADSKRFVVTAYTQAPK